MKQLSRSIHCYAAIVLVLSVALRPAQAASAGAVAEKPAAKAELVSSARSAGSSGGFNLGGLWPREFGGLREERAEASSQSLEGVERGGSGGGGSSGGGGINSFDALGEQFSSFMGGVDSTLRGRSQERKAGAIESSSSGAASSSSAGSGARGSSKDGEKDVDILKNLLNPIELIKAISAKFKLHFSKFVAAIGKPLVFGIEAALAPFTITIKIIEKVFVPDVCRLHFVCKVGSNIGFLKEHVPKFSPKFSEGSSLIKAFGEGILVGDCHSRYPCEGGEPKLKKEYEGLRKE